MKKIGCGLSGIFLFLLIALVLTFIIALPISAVEQIAEEYPLVAEELYEWTLGQPLDYHSADTPNLSFAVPFLGIDIPSSFIYQMSSTQLSDCYGALRPDYAKHTGIDYSIPENNQVLSPMGGVVSYAGWQGGYGNLVVVENQGTQVYLAHNNSILVKVGDVISAGQAVTLAGSTGNSSGPHIHFEVRQCDPEVGGCWTVDPNSTFLPGQSESCDWYFGKQIKVTYENGFSYTCGKN